MNATPEMTPEDMQAISDSLGFDPSGEQELEALEHTLLEMWKEILSNVETSRSERISPAIATKIVSSWPKMAYSEVGTYWDLYYDLMTELRSDLLGEIEKNPDCLKNIEDDAVENRKIYLEILFLWSDRIQRWDEEWDFKHPEAHLHIAAMADVAAFFVGQQGLTEHLSQPQVNFQFTEEDREELQTRLIEAAESRA